MQPINCILEIFRNLKVQLNFQFSQSLKLVKETTDFATRLKACIRTIGTLSPVSSRDKKKLLHPVRPVSSAMPIGWMAEGGGGVQWRRVTVSSGGRVKKGGCSSTPGVERDIWGGEVGECGGGGWSAFAGVGSLLVGCRIRGGNFSARSTTDVCLRSELQRKLRGLAACGGWEKYILLLTRSIVH